MSMPTVIPDGSPNDDPGAADPVVDPDEQMPGQDVPDPDDTPENSPGGQPIPDPDAPLPGEH